MAKHQINPNKLLLSKWTAVRPINKEKHFLVTRLIRDEQEVLVACVLEAVINHREYEMDWRQLTDSGIWQTGWN
jgi:tryptophan-rich hypothetical protein